MGISVFKTNRTINNCGKVGEWYAMSKSTYYDEIIMPIELCKTHRANDAAVMEAYGFRKDMTEPEIVAELFKMYQKLTCK